MPCQPARSVPLNRAVKPFGGCGSAAEAPTAKTAAATREGRTVRIVYLSQRDSRQGADEGGLNVLRPRAGRNDSSAFFDARRSRLGKTIRRADLWRRLNGWSPVRKVVDRLSHVVFNGRVRI